MSLMRFLNDFEMVLGKTKGENWVFEFKNTDSKFTSYNHWKLIKYKLQDNVSSNI